jgi:hypothetical protein
VAAHFAGVARMPDDRLAIPCIADARRYRHEVAEQCRPVARILLHPVGRLWGHRFSGAQKPSGALAFSTFTAYFYQ